jgi:hypothetical protein
MTLCSSLAPLPPKTSISIAIPPPTKPSYYGKPISPSNLVILFSTSSNHFTLHNSYWDLWTLKFIGILVVICIHTLTMHPITSFFWNCDFFNFLFWWSLNPLRIGSHLKWWINSLGSRFHSHERKIMKFNLDPKASITLGQPKINK